MCAQRAEMMLLTKYHCSSFSILSMNMTNGSIDLRMHLGISSYMIPLTCASPRNVDAHSFAADIQDESSSNLHFLILVIFKLQPIYVFLRSLHLRSVERGGFWITSQYLFSNGKIWEWSFRPRDCYQCCSCRLVNLTWSTIFVWFRVLDLVSSL